MPKILPSTSTSRPSTHNAEPQNDPPLITVDEYRERMGHRIGRNAIYQAVNEGRIRHIRVNRKILILSSEVEGWPMREAEAA